MTHPRRPRSRERHRLVAHAADDVRVEPVPVRAPDADEAVVEVVYGGICGSDLHYWRHGAAGLSILREPMLLGHEIVGVVRQAPRPTAPVRRPARRWRCTRPGPARATAPSATRPTGPTSPPAAPTSAAPRTGRTPRAAFAHYVTLGAHMLRPLPAGLALRTAARGRAGRASRGTPSAARATSGGAARW